MYIIIVFIFIYFLRYSLWHNFPLNIFFYRMAARCFWDADTDCYAQDIFMNVSEELFLHECDFHRLLYGFMFFI